MDIVERLRSVGGTEGATRYYVNPDGPEATDEIERLREENKELKFESDYLEEQNIRRNKTAIELYEENKRLQEALKLEQQLKDDVLRVFNEARASLKGDE